MTSKLATTLFVFLLMIPIVQAQSTTPGASAAEQKKARAERDKKTLALVDEITEETQSLQLPENRIRISIALADALWPRDEKRARILFNGAVTSLGEITAAVDGAEPDYIKIASLPQQLRQELLQLVASHDPGLALDFLKSTRRPPANGQPDSEARLEMGLAMEIAARDPRRALAAAEDSLKFGLDYQTMSLLQRFESSDKAVGEIFLGDILSRLRSDDFNKSPASSSIALTLVRTWIENNRPPAIPPPRRTTARLALPNFDDLTARELTDIVLAAALSNGPGDSATYQLYAGQVTGILQQLKMMLPDIERLAPDRVPALQSRIAEFDKFHAAQQGSWARYEELFQTGNVEAMMEASKNAPPEIADRLVQQAASKAYNARDIQTAYQIVEKIADPRVRSEMKSNVDRQAFYIAREEKKLAEARMLISRLASVEERVMFLAQLASSPATEADKAASVQLLAEAQSLLGDRALNYAQLQAEMEIAKAYEPVDTSTSIAIVERVIDQVNDLSAAAFALNGFDVQGYFRNGEFIIFNGNPLNMMSQLCGRVLSSNARTAFDRARLAAERFRRPEMRVIALLQVAQSLLTDDSR